jgi:Multiubiquitin
MKDFLNFKINEQQYLWHEQYITGAELKKLGNIPIEDLLFLSIKKPWADELIENDTRVDLARPGLERFYSKKHDDHHHFIIIVNGRQKDWDQIKISYEQVVKLAFDSYVENSTTIYTVTYTDGPGQNPEGSMVKGDVVYVKNKMKFNVTATNQS